MTRISSLTVTLTLLLACGRVPDRARVADLDADQIRNFCEEMVQKYPPQTVSCTIVGVTVDVDVGYDATVEECVDTFQAPPSNCPLLVGDLRSCFDDTFGAGDDFCSALTFGVASSCDRVYSDACYGVPDEPESL